MIEEPNLFVMALLFLLLLIYKSCFEDVFERQLKRVSYFAKGVQSPQENRIS